MDSDIPIWPEGLPTPLVDRKHTILPRGIETTMESGRIRSRQVHLEPIEVMDVTWNFTEDQYEAFRTFFIGTLLQGELSFAMTTFEPAPDPSKVRETVRAYAFLDGTYAFSGSDNLISVQATLELDSEEFTEIDNPFWVDPTIPELPDLPVTYTACKEETMLTWDFVTGDVVQTATSSAGPWYQYIFPRLTESENASPFKTKVLHLNNSFNGERWFRIADADGNARTKMANPVPSNVQPPLISLSGVTDSALGMRICPIGPGFTDTVPPTLITEPLSYVENTYVNPWEFYLEPVGRKHFVTIEGGYGEGSTILSITEQVGAETKWTRNGADPDALTANPKKGATLNHADVLKDDFACVIRARSFLGECKSPMVVLLVDKEYDETSSPAQPTLVTTRIRQAWFQTQYWWPYLVPGSDPPEWWYIGGNRTSLSPTVTPLAARVMISSGIHSYICANTVEVTNVMLDRMIAKFYPGEFLIGFLDATLFESIRYIASVRKYVRVVVVRQPSWNTRPTEVFEYTKFSENLAGNDLYYRTGTVGYRVSGPGGTMEGPEAYTDGICSELGNTVCPIPGWTFVPPVRPEGEITDWGIVTTRYDDEPVDPDEVVPDPVDPDLPDPPYPPGFAEYFDLFEDYDDGDAPIQVLDQGEGWTAAWVLNVASIFYGEDLWDGYLQHEDGALDLDDPYFVFGEGGEGWTGAWAFQTNEEELYYGDDWESYVDGVIDPVNQFDYTGGTGWSLAVPEFSDGQVSWFFNLPLIGGEDWESYSDQVIAAETVLNYNGDAFWMGGTEQWYFNGV